METNETKHFLDAYYQNYDEDGRLLSRRGQVEYRTTMRYVERYLFPGAKVLEIGAGTGRYSHALARQGYAVDAVELVEHNIEIFRRNTQPGEQVTVRQGNATDLAAFDNDTYDLTLLLGPMYHLFTRREQQAALAEAVRVTRPGGVVFAAYCMGDASILQYGFGRGQIHNIIRDCLLDPETFETFSNPWDLFQLYRKEQIDALRAVLPVTQLHYVAADGMASYLRELLDGMDEATYELYVKYHLTVCERPDLTGYSNHTLDIFRKN